MQIRPQSPTTPPNEEEFLSRSLFGPLKPPSETSKGSSERGGFQLWNPPLKPPSERGFRAERGFREFSNFRSMQSRTLRCCTLLHYDLKWSPLTFGVNMKRGKEIIAPSETPLLGGFQRGVSECPFRNHPTGMCLNRCFIIPVTVRFVRQGRPGRRLPWHCMPQLG